MNKWIFLLLESSFLSPFYPMKWTQEHQATFLTWSILMTIPLLSAMTAQLQCTTGSPWTAIRKQKRSWFTWRGEDFVCLMPGKYRYNHKKCKMIISGPALKDVKIRQMTPSPCAQLQQSLSSILTNITVTLYSARTLQKIQPSLTMILVKWLSPDWVFNVNSLIPSLCPLLQQWLLHRNQKR